mmetsp:Transcript_69302/g.122672  ORF Transcript_69302/g.122672 Transcript_69302/m.122672 type:complete len:1105 (+) Transcript_69302:56-3370(+)
MAPFWRDEDSSPSSIWLASDDDDTSVPPPPVTLRTFSTPGGRSQGKRGTPDPAAVSPFTVNDQGGGSTSSRLQQSGVRGEVSPRVKAESPFLQKTYNQYKVDSGDLKALHHAPKANSHISGFEGNGVVQDAGFNSAPRLRASASSLSAALRSTFSADSTTPPSSAAGSSWKKPQAAAMNALRYLGLVQNGGPNDSFKKSSAPKPLVDSLLELAIAICFATATECADLASSFTSEDTNALMRLLRLAERSGLVGRIAAASSGAAASLSPAEIASAFLGTSEPQEAKSRRPTFLRNMSTTSMLSNTSGAPGGYRSGVRFAGDDGRPKPRGGLARQDSTVSNRSTVSHNAFRKFNRSQSTKSDMSVTSFGDFNHKMGMEDGADDDTEEPVFLEFLSILLKGDEEQPVFPGREVTSQAEGTTMMIDLIVPDNFGRASSVDDENAAALCTATIGDGEEKETLNAEVVNFGRRQGGTSVRLAFKSKVLRTQNERQRQLLKQQRALLDVVTGKLQAAQQTLKQDVEVKEEERALLRGFRKIIRREPGNEDKQTPLQIYVVERRAKLKAEIEEMCNILSYPCESFNTFGNAMTAVSEASQESIQRVMSVMSVYSNQSSATRVRSNNDLLDGRPGSELGDWRSRALCTASITAGNVVLDTPVRIVLLGMAWLTRGLPAEWEQQRVYVVLVSEAAEFEEVGRQLGASGESEIREKLREKGLSDYLIYPLSLDSISTVVSQAEQSRFDEYLLLDMLGRGATACVHKAKRLRDNETFALKEINTRRMNQDSKAEIDREVRLLEELSWPTVVFMLDTWESAKEKLRYLALPLLDGGSMLQRIEYSSGKKNDEEDDAAGPYSLERVADWYAQTIHGLAYCHWRGVIHRDIKPGNLLISADNKSLQIGDLGSAMLLPGTGPYPNRHALVNAPVCSPSYASPESLLKELHLASSDMWCVGASFFEALTLHPLFPNVENLGDAQAHVKAFDPSMAAPSNGVTNYAVAALSTLNQIRSSSASAEAAVALAADLPDLLRPDFLQRPSAAALGARSVWLKRLKYILRETGAVPKAGVNTHLENYKIVLKQSQAADQLKPEQAGVQPVTMSGPGWRGGGPRPPRR